MGADNARSASQQLIQTGVTGLISWGTAAGLDAKLKSGDLILADTTISDSGTRYQSDPNLTDTINNKISSTGISIYRGSIYSSKTVISSTTDKKEINQQTGALAVDMESSSVLQVAGENQLPGLALRVIIDTAAMELPGKLIELTDEFGQPDKLKVLSMIFSSPAIMFRLVELGLAMHKAKMTMKVVARKLQVNALLCT